MAARVRTAAVAVAVVLVATNISDAGAEARPRPRADDHHAIADGVRRGSTCPWLVPVEAEVLDGFRPPDHRYGPGNRGIEYRVDGGEVVRAVGDGRVRFSGPVGGRVFVVVEHDDGLRSTYGPVFERQIVGGQAVSRGEAVAVAAPGFHLTARVGDGYVDPQPLIDGRCGHARLISTRPLDHAVALLGWPGLIPPAPRPIPPRVR